jgi:hypothetical protein
MSSIHARRVGVELYFDDLVAANFFPGTPGLNIFGEPPGRHAQFDLGQGFLCLEKRAGKRTLRGIKR